MHHRWAALALVLALCAIAPEHAAGQLPVQPRGRKLGALGPNFPNPFNPETTIPFRVGTPDCPAGSERHVVSLRIYNVLTQLVAVPTLQAVISDSARAAATTPPAAPVAAPATPPVTNLTLVCGEYLARWNGRHLHGNREAAAGVYVVQLIVDGHALPVRKMMMAK